MFYKKEITATNFKGKVNLAEKDFCQHKYAYLKVLIERCPNMRLGIEGDISLVTRGLA